MNKDETHPDRRGPSRKPVILIGAPSGAGKTMLSRNIISGAFPLFAELCKSTPDETPISYGLKVLPDDPPRDRILIIECSTYKFERLTRTDPWRRMVELIRESELVVHVNLVVPRGTVARQYFSRIFTQPRRMNPLYRILQFSKYRTTLVYMLTRELARANEAWYRFGRGLAGAMPPRVAIVRAQRTGADYHLHLEEVPAPSPTPHPRQVPTGLAVRR